jgi:CMP-N,N'-diacetyllegionaminic acid synthase
VKGSTIALIPARSGSKEVLDKNIRSLGGLPLLAWSIAAARGSRQVDRVIVSTDSREYGDIAEEHGAEVPFLRPPTLAADNSPDVGFVIHALDWLAEQQDEPRHLVHLRPTTPFRTPDIIDDAIRAFAADDEATALRSVHEMSTTAYKSMEITSQGILRQVGAAGTDLDRANDPRQSFPATFLANGYIDVLSTDFIRSSGMLHGNRVIPFITPLALEVDTMEDFDMLEYHLARHPDLLDRVFG